MDDTLNDLDLEEALEERAAWLTSMRRNESKVEKDEEGVEFIISTGDDGVKVYLPDTIQNITQ